MLLYFLQVYFPKVKVETKEVELESFLQHTFLRIIILENEPFICDGVGILKHDPFWNYESEAPKHLQDSNSDMINKYL